MVDINSVCRIQPQSQQHVTKIDIPVQTTHTHHEKNVLIYNINKEINADFKIERNEKIIDDDDEDYDDYSGTKTKVLHIDVKNHIEIPERKPIVKQEAKTHIQTLIIDDADGRRKTANIESELHSKKNVLNLDANKPTVNHFERKSFLQIDEDNAFGNRVENIKIKAEHIDAKKPLNTSVLRIDEHLVNHVVIDRKLKPEVVVINDDHRLNHREQIDIDDRHVTKRKKEIYEDVYDVNSQKKVDDDEWRTEIYEQSYLVKKPRGLSHFYFDLLRRRNTFARS